MNIVRVDAIGDNCPIPVVKAKKAIDALTESAIVEISVDNEIAVQNVTKMLNQKNLESTCEKVAENHYLIKVKCGEVVENQAAKEVVTTAEKEEKVVVVLSSDKMGNSTIINDMAPSQAIRLLSELNHSMNNDLTFIMKLVNPDTKLSDLQMWIDARSVNINTGSSPATDMKADEILRLSGVSRDKIRDAFDALLHQIDTSDDVDITAGGEVDDFEES